MGDSALRATIHRSNWEQAFLSYERADRGSIKVFIDGVISRIGGVITAATLMLLIAIGGASGVVEVPWIPLTLGVLGIGWVYLTFQLRRVGCAPCSPDEPLAIQLPDS